MLLQSQTNAKRDVFELFMLHFSHFHFWVNYPFKDFLNIDKY